MNELEEWTLHTRSRKEDPIVKHDNCPKSGIEFDFTYSYLAGNICRRCLVDIPQAIYDAALLM